MGQTPAALGWGKPLALLCYLAIRGAVRRDEIVDLLWRDVDEAKARNAFRQALHRLRTALGDDLIPHDRDRLRLEGSARLTIDVTDFEKFVNAGRFDEAVDVYSGDFLEGSELGEVAFDHWCEQERTRLRTRFRQVLRDSVLEASSTGRWTDAIAHAKRLQTLAPFEPDAAKQRHREIADPAVAFAERERVPEKRPAEPRETERTDAHHHRVESVLLADEPSVEESEGGSHEEHHGRGDEQPGGVRIVQLGKSG